VLNWNARKVKNLTGLEIWLFIIGRGLVAFGAGILAVRYFPGIVEPMGFPAVAIGLIVFLIGIRGMFRQRSS
jgi:hypothetical protein